MDKSKVLFLGGSFNPPHHGHIAIAEQAIRELGVDHVGLVVSADHPFKARNPDHLPFETRYEMTRLATAGEPGLFASDVERSIPGKTYTISVVRALKAQGFDPVRWAIGADILPEFGKWHQWEQLLEEAQIYVLQRPGYPVDQSDPVVQRVLGCSRVAQVLLNESSSEVRRNIATGEPWEHMVPEEVADFIKENKLYA